MSGKALDDLRAGERIAVDDGKQDAMDFVLWKAAKPTEPADAKWSGATNGHDYGQGRPGWHIECSAMCTQTLGDSFDIHGGGMDLQFPHHENEIAQTEGVTGQPMAQVWMHNGLVQLDNEKMSKSLGNFFTIREVLSKYDPQTVRFFLVRGHYRTALGYSDAHLDDARSALKRLYTALDLVPPAPMPNGIDWQQAHAQRFKAAMDDDFGTPEAVAVLFELANEVNRSGSAELSALLKALAGCLGLLQGNPKEFLQAGAKLDDARHQCFDCPARRCQSRKKLHALADQIRKDLLAQGIVLKDSPSRHDLGGLRSERRCQGGRRRLRRPFLTSGRRRVAT